MFVNSTLNDASQDPKGSFQIVCYAPFCSSVRVVSGLRVASRRRFYGGSGAVPARRAIVAERSRGATLFVIIATVVPLLSMLWFYFFVCRTHSPSASPNRALKQRVSTVLFKITWTKSIGA